MQRVKLHKTPSRAAGWRSIIGMPAHARSYHESGVFMRLCLLHAYHAGDSLITIVYYSILYSSTTKDRRGGNQRLGYPMFLSINPFCLHSNISHTSILFRYLDRFTSHGSGRVWLCGPCDVSRCACSLLLTVFKETITRKHHMFNMSLQSF